ncbi:hypothetical protein AVEN_88788-1 [Araneus ventricosus]|uniref:Uncharacterized protein n=1 Tax=Araneus ventricosus TaxID=182803 RepID=A0A4Y2VLF5_ARAVE|nr:hypothetical protein AVEN_88788-1 [Araneus ventricosus]
MVNKASNLLKAFTTSRCRQLAPFKLRMLRDLEVPAFGIASVYRANFFNLKPAGVASPKLYFSNICHFPSPCVDKKFEPTVTQNAMTIRRFFIVDYSDSKILR